jgi:four helix bundle protein
MGLRLEELEIYKVSMEIGDLVWQIVMEWGYFEKDTLGKQFVRAADSIAFNISEGYGRFHFKDNLNFCYYSRGSAKETLTALEKAKNRNLVTDNQYNVLSEKLTAYFKLSYYYIKSIGTTKSSD